jgi:hypothetical protein
VTLTHSADCHDPVCPQPHDQQQASRIDADLLGRAIREHRQAEFEPHQYVLTHLCFDDCAEDIAVAV